MLITRLQLKNWRNFKEVDIALRERVYVIGANASGKSNLLDALRFLRDVAKPGGGGLQAAVADRGGVSKLRSLLARRDPEVRLLVELSGQVDDVRPKWRYTLAFKNENKGMRRVLITMERIENLLEEKDLLSRPDKSDEVDSQRKTQTALEQISANKPFRELAEFLGAATYLHLVPQLLKYADQMGGRRLEGDPFGQVFLERIAELPEKTRKSRLGKIEKALKICVPNMRQLKFVRDESTGKPHLEALYEHWRPGAGWQREDQFSDGSLRLLALMWSLLDGDSLLLLEEPELSLNEEIVRHIHAVIYKVQQSSRRRRQVIITTHSEALLQHEGLDPREVIRLEAGSDGSKAYACSEEEKKLVAAGYSVAETMMPKVRPQDVEQLSLFVP